MNIELLLKGSEVLNLESNNQKEAEKETKEKILENKNKFLSYNLKIEGNAENSKFKVLE